MFHVMLVFPIFFVIVILISIFLFSIFTLLASAFGGAATALFIKNKMVRRLLFIGFSILSLIGLLCLLPFITLYAELPALFFTVSAIITLSIMAILSIVGVKLSAAIQNKVGRTTLYIVFGLVLTAAAALAIFIGVNGI